MVKYGAWFEKQMEFYEIKSTRKYVSWHYILMSLALDVEKLCSVLGKLLVSPDLFSKCSDARSPGKIDSTGKSEPILTLIKSRFATKIR